MKTIKLVFVILFSIAIVSCGGGETNPVQTSIPTGVTAIAGKGQVTIGWNAVTGVSAYNIYMATQSGVTKSNYTTLAGGMTHTGVTSPYAHTGLTNGTTYYFVVTAVESAGESAASAEVSATPASNNVWTAKAPMPTARAMLTSGVVNGKIYAIGGILGDSRNISLTVGSVEEYDPVTNAWVTKATMPTARRLLASGVVNGKFYAIGGAGTSNLSGSIVEEYDPATNIWASKASMPTARNNITGAVVNGKIYVMGGCCSISTVEEYDPVTNTWATKAPMPTAREGLTSAVVNGKIYAIGGGYRAVDNSIIGLATVEEYDPATDTWATKASVPTVGAGAATSGVVNGKIYVFGGFIGSALSTVYEYDPATNIWATKASMPTARYHLASGVVGGEIYVIGGSDGAAALSTLQAYTP